MSVNETEVKQQTQIITKEKKEKLKYLFNIILQIVVLYIQC